MLGIEMELDKSVKHKRIFAIISEDQFVAGYLSAPNANTKHESTSHRKV